MKTVGYSKAKIPAHHTLKALFPFYHDCGKQTSLLKMGPRSMPRGIPALSHLCLGENLPALSLSILAYAA